MYTQGRFVFWIILKTWRRNKCCFSALCQMIQIWTQCAGDHLITCVIIHFHYCHHHHDQRHDHHHDSQHQQHDQRLSSIEETWSSTSLQPRPRPRRKVLKLFYISLFNICYLSSLLSLWQDGTCRLPFLPWLPLFKTNYPSWQVNHYNDDHSHHNEECHPHPHDHIFNGQQNNSVLPPLDIFLTLTAALRYI